MGRIRFIPLVLLTLALVIACSSDPVATGPTTEEDPTPTPETSTGPAASATGEFFLNVSSPQDESVVTSGTTTVHGHTVADAVVTVNGAIVPVGPDGTFSRSLIVQEGPNFVEVIASNMEGNEASVLLSIIYLP